MIPPNSICWEYQWLDVPLSSQTMTLSSFIQVGELKMFRLGVKCSADRKTLKVCCFSENRLLSWHFGVRLGNVTCTFHSVEMVVEMVTGSEPAWNRPGIFSASFEDVPVDPVITTSTFTFHFYLTGLVNDYARERFDSFLVEKLWDATEEKNMTDVLINVGERSFSAHKFVLAARSPVFQAMFDADMVEARTGVVQIDDVDPDIFRQFLRFLYTGQLDGPITAELGAVAQKYDVKTLEALCKAVNKSNRHRSPSEVDVEELDDLIASAGSLHELDGVPWVTKDLIETHSSSSVQINEIGGVPALCDVQLCDTSETLLSHTRDWAFSQGFHTKLSRRRNSESKFPNVISFLSSQTKSHGLSVADVAFSLEDYESESCYSACPELEPIRRYKLMKSVRSLTCVENEQPLEMFSTDFEYSPEEEKHFSEYTLIRCSARLVSTIPSFTFKFRDALYSRQLWNASLSPKLTDYTIDVGDRSFAVHQALLSARCPTLVNAPRINEADESAMEELLYFLYTGTIKTTIPCPAPLLQVAEIYKVSTLKLLGQAHHRFQMNRDKFSKVLMLCCN